MTSGSQGRARARGKDVPEGGTGRDRLMGGAMSDRPCGDEDANRLEGGDGNDQFQGGPDADNLVGGSGGDTFTFVTRRASPQARRTPRLPPRVTTEGDDPILA